MMATPLVVPIRYYPRLPWILLAALVLIWAASRSMGSEAADRARAAEAAVAVLRPLADSLRIEAERRDTVLVAVTDTVRVTVTRERVVQIRVVDSVAAHVDSVGAIYLDSLVASEAAEDVAQGLLQAETLAWGTVWREMALTAQAGWDQERVRGDAWEAAARAQGRRTWVERGAVAVVAVGVLLLR